MAKKINEKIRALLKDGSSYTIEEIAKNLGTNTYEAKQFLLEFLYSELCSIEPNQEQKKVKYLFKIFKYFETCDNKKEYEIITTSLDKCSRLCKKRLLKYKDLDLPEDNNYNKFNDIINVTLLGLDYQMGKEGKSENEVSYELLDYIINHLKNYNYLFELLKTFPRNLTVKNRNDEYLIESLVDKYIEEVLSNKSPSYIIYYEKIIKLFITNTKFYVDKEIEKRILEKLKGSLMKVYNSEDIIDKDRCFFFINEAINDIKQTTEKKDLKTDLEKLNYKYGIITSFPQDALSESLREIKIHDMQTLDCTDKYTITVDNENTWVYDDACSLEILPNGNFLLGIYVADATKHIKRGSIVDKEALRRIETVYAAPDMQVTMLPVDLTKKLSLKEDCDRGAIGIFFEITPNIKVVNYDIKRCIIRVNKNCSYEEIDSIFNSDSTVGFAKTIKDMHYIAGDIQDLSMYGTKYRELKKIKKNLLDNVDNPTEVKINSSYNMIAQFMTEANTVIANYFYRHPEIPFIYRSNLASYSVDSIQKIKEISKANVSFDELRTYIKYILPPSIYTPVNLGHNSLRLDAYCHFTDPLRKYCSLECERIVVDHIVNGETEPISTDKFYYRDLCNYMNERINLNTDYCEEVKELYKRYNVDK